MATNEKTARNPASCQIAGLLFYAVVISLYFPDTHPTWLPIFTAYQPFWTVAIHSHSIPSGTAVMRT